MMNLKSPRRRRSFFLTPALLFLALTTLAVLAVGDIAGKYNLSVIDTGTGLPLPIFATTNGNYVTNYLVINSSMTNNLIFQLMPSDTLTNVTWTFPAGVTPNTASGTNVMVSLDTNNFPTTGEPVTITSSRFTTNFDIGLTPVLCTTDNHEVVMLLPIQLRVTTRDDPTATWADNVLQTGLVPVYAGQNSGDMVSWTIPMSSLTSGTFTWTVTDVNGNAVSDESGNTITGPSGVGINEWRIATWTAGGNDPHNQWLNWKAGTYNITCTVSFSGGGSIPIKFQQTVGQRSKDVVVIGWINPAGVPLSTTGVDSDVLQYFPSNDIFTTVTQQGETIVYLGTLGLGNTYQPLLTTTQLSETDKTYILDWMFKFAGNQAPPNSFPDENTLDVYKATEGTNTGYKLFNRLEISYFVNGTQFKGSPQLLHDESLIGTTVDPVQGQLYPGQAGPNNDFGLVTDFNTFHQTVDGSPDAWAVAAFNTLMSPLKWNNIGDRIDEGVSLDQGTPPITGYTVETQVYPTYYIYERESDGGFYLINTIPQASTPSGNFNSNPYPPGPAPYILSY